ncbi:MAG TPA: hypothetical protein VM238_01850 [Phycisphaerae bacterium]|nr:hypothetical protein [Phycisphaerae bacterium]
MELIPTSIPRWPKLAWVAELQRGSRQVKVYHGPMVEVANRWVVEAVWAGDFASGDFDQTDLVFGSGIRLRDGQAVFVNSGTTLDRLWSCCHDGTWYVSNSLAALLAVARLSLRDDYQDYSWDMRTIDEGLEHYRRCFPTTSDDMHMIYFHNLIWDGFRLGECEKPDPWPTFNTFEDYHGFLVRSMERLGKNLADPARRFQIKTLVSISSGYDSPAAAVLSRHAGCDRAATLKTATSLLRRPDSGEAIATRLGFACLGYPRVAERYPHEESVWAVIGRPGVLNWTLFDYPEPLCLFFTGSQGGTVWDRIQRVLLGAPVFSSESYWSLGICEFRLLKGLFQCPVPLFGVRHRREIEMISFSKEMEPWTMHNDYDRPIPRRVLEEAGVPRGSFAVRKENTSHEAAFLWPYSPESQARFRSYLRSRGSRALSPFAVSIIRCLALFEHLLHTNVLAKLRLKRRLRPWWKARSQSLLFQWANHELKKRYEQGLQDIGRSVERTQPQHESKP